jgi:hypothetical protein
VRQRTKIQDASRSNTQSWNTRRSLDMYLKGISALDEEHYSRLQRLRSTFHGWCGFLSGSPRIGPTSRSINMHLSFPPSLLIKSPSTFTFRFFHIADTALILQRTRWLRDSWYVRSTQNTPAKFMILFARSKLDAGPAEFTRPTGNPSRGHRE